MVFLLFLVAIIPFVCIYIYKERYVPYKYEQDLTDKVRWIVISQIFGSIFVDNRIHKTVRDRELYQYIEREQHKLKVDNKFCIDFSNEQEKDFICEILEIHKQSVIKSFFMDSLTKDNAFYRLKELEYYMFSLQGFLDDNIKGNINDIYLLKYHQKDGSYTTYKLTDYGIIYEKLHYITAFFCVNNKNVEPLFTDSKHTLNGIKQTLEKGEITFWSYRP